MVLKIQGLLQKNKKVIKIQFLISPKEYKNLHITKETTIDNKDIIRQIIILFTPLLSLLTFIL